MYIRLCRVVSLFTLLYVKVAWTGTRTLAPVWQGLARGISLTPCPRLGTKQAYECDTGACPLKRELRKGSSLPSSISSRFSYTSFQLRRQPHVLLQRWVAGYPAACSNHSPIPSLSSYTPSASPTPSATSFISTIPKLLTAYYSCTISSLAPTNVTASSFLPPAPLFSLFSKRLQPTSAKSSLIAKFLQRPIMLTKLIKSLSAHALLRAHSVTANDSTADTVPALHPKVTWIGVR